MVSVNRHYFMDEFAREVGVTRRQIERYLVEGWLQPVGCSPGGRYMYFTDAEVKLCRERGQRRRGLKPEGESTTPPGTTQPNVSAEGSRFIHDLLTKRRIGSPPFSSKEPISIVRPKPDFMD